MKAQITQTRKLKGVKMNFPLFYVPPVLIYSALHYIDHSVVGPISSATVYHHSFSPLPNYHAKFVNRGKVLQSMADDGANDSAANDVVELEALAKDGLSWHPCQVSLCPRGLGLIVLHENNKLEEMITDIKEISARIRVRSTPLQGDDCLSLRQGEHVLATQNSHVNGIFYDARVEKVINVRHSKRIHCRCSFTIKWLHHAVPEEALTVPASAIMKLSTKSIHLHPTISAFFGMQETPYSLDAMPCSMLADGKNWEFDINLLIEQQIKAISTSTDIPQENILKDAPAHKGQSHGNEIEASLKDTLQGIPFLDKLKGSNGSENKQPTELILETPPAPSPSIQEELTGRKLLLNPLAARAALASLRSESPRSPELSAWCNEKGDATGKRSVSSLQQGSTFCSFPAVDHSSNAGDFSLKISATLEGKSPNIRSIAKKLFPTSSPPHVVEISNLSSSPHPNVMENKSENGEKKTAVAVGKRLTRSQMQRNNVMHDTSYMTNNNEKQFSDTRRFTRSRVGGAEKAEAEEYDGAVKGHVIPEFTKLETFSQSSVAPRSNLSDNQRAVASPINGQMNTRRVTRSRVKGVEKTEANEYNAATDNVHNDCTNSGAAAPKYCFSDEQKVLHSTIDGDTSIQFIENEKGILGKDGKVFDTDTQKVNLIQNMEKCSTSKRLTRSSAREDTESDNVQPKQKLRRSDLTESNASTEGSGIQRSLISPIATEINDRFDEEGESKKMSTPVKTTRKVSESSVGGGGEGTRKSATSKRPETRSSPRLRFLPRTRSQNKA